MSDAELPQGGAYIADVNALVKAGAFWITKSAWPFTPPDLRPYDAVTVGAAADGAEWSLWISPALKRLTKSVLTGQIGRQFAKRPLSGSAADA